MTDNNKTSRSKFDRASVYTCIICGKRTRNIDGESAVELCKDCYEECEKENMEADQPTERETRNE